MSNHLLRGTREQRRTEATVHEYRVRMDSDRSQLVSKTEPHRTHQQANMEDVSESREHANSLFGAIICASSVVVAAMG